MIAYHARLYLSSPCSGELCSPKFSRRRHVATTANLCYAFANMQGKNQLYFGDNLKILSGYVPDARLELIGVGEPTTPMLTEADALRFYESKDFAGHYSRQQILTIAELLAEKRLEYPAHRVVTFAKAERKTKSEQEDLF